MRLHAAINHVVKQNTWYVSTGDYKEEHFSSIDATQVAGRDSYVSITPMEMKKRQSRGGHTGRYT